MGAAGGAKRQKTGQKRQKRQQSVKRFSQC
jgi:hypothetical protein